MIFWARKPRASVSCRMSRYLFDRTVEGHQGRGIPALLAGAGACRRAARALNSKCRAASNRSVQFDSIIRPRAGAKLDFRRSRPRRSREVSRRDEGVQSRSTEAVERPRHREARGKSRKMIANRTGAPSVAYFATSDSPAILRLQMLEMKIAVEAPCPMRATLGLLTSSTTSSAPSPKSRACLSPTPSPS